MSYDKTLNIIFSNEVIMESLKALFLEEAEKNCPKVTGQNDDTLGQEYRSYCKAKEIIEDSFIHLHSLHGVGSGTNSIRYK